MKNQSLPRLSGHFVQGMFFVLLCLPLFSVAQVETGRWTSKTKGPVGQLPIFFPTPLTTSGNPELLLVPLLGPQHLLLPGGKLLVWVGRNDGTPLASTSVTIRVPSPGNALVSGGNRVTEATVQTNADGIATVYLASPDIPPTSTDDSNNGGGGPVAG